VSTRGAPAVITVEMGQSFIRDGRTRSAYQCGVRLIFQPTRETMDNPFIETFNGRLRDEHLNVERSLGR